MTLSSGNWTGFYDITMGVQGNSDSEHCFTSPFLVLVLCHILFPGFSEAKRPYHCIYILVVVPTVPGALQRSRGRS